MPFASPPLFPPLSTMRAELIGHFKACMTEIYVHIDARMADYIHTHPYLLYARLRLSCALLVVLSCIVSRLSSDSHSCPWPWPWL